MASRTYERTLIELVKRLAKYIGRYNPQLQQYTTSQEFTCIMSLLTALNDCLAVLQPPADGN